MAQTGKQKLRDSSRYHDLKKAGLCVECGVTPPGPSSNIMCEFCRDDINERHRNQRAEAKRKVFDHYGWRCACKNCPETNPNFCTIDHINGGGRQHLKEIGQGQIYKWLVRNSFPEEFQTLCFNCNTGKSTNGGTCPHETQTT